MAWVVPPGSRWSGPTDQGQALEVDGLLLRGCHDLVTALVRFLPADCLGFAAGPSDLIAAMTTVHQYAILCPPTTAQHAAVEALKNGHKAV